VGPWLPALEPTLAPLLSVQREAMCWFEIENHADAYARLPIFIWLHGPGPADLCYGFPAVAGPSGGVKVATEVYGEPTTPAAVDRTVTDAEAAAVHAAHVRGRLRGLSPRCHRREVCLYTVTPDFGFVVDTLPGAPQVVIASACSGHGFKHAPAVGEAVAQMALGRAPTQDLAAFSLSRFDLALFWSVTWPPEEDDGLPHLAGMRRAPLIVVPLSHKGAYLDRYAEADKGWTDRDEARWPVPYWDIDTGFAALLMLLTVVDEGLGACFFGIAPGRIAGFRAAFGVPDALTPIGAVSIGHRAHDAPSPSIPGRRRQPGSVVHHGRY